MIDRTVDDVMETVGGHQYAYPQQVECIDGVVLAAGLTKREHFAAMAMQGLLSDPAAMHNSCPDNEVPKRFVARQAVSLADALLEELERTK